MQTQLYPADLVEDSLESHLSRHARRGRAVYLATLLTVLGAVGALPLVRVPVVVQGHGLVRPGVEKHQVRARAAGVVETVTVRPHQRVRRGQTLLRLRAEALDSRRGALEGQLARARAEARDLRLLIGAAEPGALAPERLHAALYRQELAQLQAELADLELQREQAARELGRVRALAERGLLSGSEVEQAELRRARLDAEWVARLARARSGWHASLGEARLRLEQLLAERRQAANERTMQLVEAPVAGTLEELAGLSPGSFVQAGERLAVISPSAELVAEVYVAPRDVGSIRDGTRVRVLVDAFSHHLWGVLPGRVRSVSDDFLPVDGRPMFRVEVSLERTHLRLRNGVRGELRKGMTVRALFLVGERTLWQLLRQGAGGWLDPAGGG